MNPWCATEFSGNLREWCQDRFGDYGRPVREGDGERQTTEEAAGGHRVIRDGSYVLLARSARSSSRGRAQQDFSDFLLGVRPARELSAEE